MDQFLAQVVAVFQQFGGMSGALKIAAVVTLVIASMKVSFLNSLIWSKLGSAQAFLAPVLGLVVGILGLAGHAPLSIAAVFAYLSAGAGAIILHELLDAIKGLPGLGAAYVSFINLIESFLGGPAPTLK